MDDFKMSIDYLPIGTAVKLKEGKTVVIMGYFVTDEDITDVYDYCGCLYPEGFDEVSDMFLFDEDQIDDIEGGLMGDWTGVWCPGCHGYVETYPGNRTKLH